MELIFASSNQNKAKEIQAVLPDGIQILTLNDLGFTGDIPETASTLEGNALLKAQFVAERWDKNCFSDDSGLEITALNQEPGVFSARYAGPQRNDQDNMDLVLQKLEGVEDRSACFKTVIALIYNKETFIFEGRVDGIIRPDKKGSNGFGYDPIFEPEGLGKTFAEMSLEEKSRYSHRKRSTEKMVSFLAQQIHSIENITNT